MSKKADSTTVNNDNSVILSEDEIQLDENQDDGKDQDIDESNDVVVTIGEDSPTQEENQVHAPEWVRELRKNYRELQREKRELEEKLKGSMPAEAKPASLSQKPKLENYDYDTDKYETALADWYEQKRKIDEQTDLANAETRAANDAWNLKLDSYGKARSELKVKDFDDAEHVVQETLSKTQQGIILQGAENPALLVYALGKNPKKAKELASITDPVKYAFAVAKLETQLKVSQRKAPPPEDTVVRGTGSSSGAVDSTLDRLRADAAKTGDYTKVTQYKMQRRRAK